MRTFILPGLLALALTSGSALAQTQSQTQTDQNQMPKASGQFSAGQSSTGQSAAQTQAQSGKAMGMGKEITTAQAQDWVGKRVYSSADQDIGEISAFKAGSSDNVDHFVADIGGFLGIGETSVQVKPDQLEMRGDRLYLNMTKQEAMKLPKAQKEKQ